MTRDRILRAVDHHLSGLPVNVASIRSAQSSLELRRAWEEFLLGYSRAMGKLISGATKNAETRPWGHRLKRTATRDDPGLVYIHEARNIAEHGLEPFAEFHPDRTLMLGGRVEALSGVIMMSGNTLNGVQDGDYTVEILDGRPVMIAGEPRFPVRHIPFQMKLIPLRNEDNGKLTPIPTSLGGKLVDPGSPTELAEAALAFLLERRKQFAKPPMSDSASA